MILRMLVGFILTRCFISNIFLTVVCQLEDIIYGVSEPPSGWIAKIGSQITVKCDDGYMHGGRSVAVTTLSSCTSTPACSSKMTAYISYCMFPVVYFKTCD